MNNVKNIVLRGVSYDIQGIVDTTLSLQGIAADSKAVGDAVGEVATITSDDIDEIIAEVTANDQEEYDDENIVSFSEIDAIISIIS